VIDFDLVNVGATDASNVGIRATSDEPWLTFKDTIYTVPQLKVRDKVSVRGAFPFRVETPGYTDSSFAGRITFEIKLNEQVVGTQSVFVFPIPVSRYITESTDVEVLDGRTADLATYHNAAYNISQESVTGGKGNGNGILEPGEQAILYVRLPQGLGPEDI